MNLDFSFITGDLLVNYIWGGLKYSVLLTLVAMAGVFVCQHHSQYSVGHGHPMVLPAGAIHHRAAHWR